MTSYSEVYGIQLLTPKRIDILARYRYAQAIIGKFSPVWGLNVYREFLEKSCLVSGYSEDGKSSFFDYLNSYNSLISSVLENGFDPNISHIPVHNSFPINGAHRIAVALATGMKIPIKEVTEASKYLYTFDRILSLGLSSSISDDILLAYAELKDTFRYLILMGTDDLTHKDFSKLARKNDNFIATKEIELSEIGVRRLLNLMYEQNLWWTDELLELFVSLRFDNAQATRKATLAFFDFSSQDEFLSLKVSLRKILFSHSDYARCLHGCDTHSEALALAQSTLNVNSLFFLNNSPLGSENRITEEIKRFQWKNKEINNLSITGSASLEVFGIRRSRDLDVVQGDSPIDGLRQQSKSKYIYQHYELTPNYGEKVYDPRHFMYISGFKFVSLPSIVLFKLSRGQGKDLKDISLIWSFIQKERRSLYANSNLFEKAHTYWISRLQKWGLQRKLIALYYYAVSYVKRILRFTR